MDKIHARIQESVYTKAEWEAANPVLLKGEKGFVSDDPNLFKIGDGVTAWNSLPWRGYTGTIAQVTGDNENAVMSQKATVAAIQAEAQERNEADEQLNTAIEFEKNRAEAAEEANAQGIIYDVSAHNNGAVFESLSALLSSSDLDTLIPTSARHGGMSIRFIQSSDNKYVQFFCKAQSFTTNTSEWEKINLGKELVSLSQELNLIIDGESIIDKDIIWSNGYINGSTGVITDSQTSQFSQPILLKAGERVSYKTDTTFSKAVVQVADSTPVQVGDTLSGNVIINYGSANTLAEYIAEEDIYIVITCKKTSNEIYFTKFNQESVNKRISDLEKELHVGNPIVYYIPSNVGKAIGTDGVEISTSGYYDSNYCDIKDAIEINVIDLYSNQYGVLGYAFYDSDKRFISGSPSVSGPTVINGSIIIPDGVSFIRFTTIEEYRYSAKIKVKSSYSESRLNGLDENLKQAEEKLTELDATEIELNNTFIDNTFINEGGSVSTNTEYAATDFIDIRNSSKIDCKGVFGNIYGGGVNFYDETKSHSTGVINQSSDGTQKTEEKTITNENYPAGSAYIRLTCYKVEKGECFAKVIFESGRIPNIENDITLIESKINKNNSPIVGKKNTIVNNESLSITIPSIKKNDTISFHARVSTFDEIRIYQGTSSIYSAGISIDSTNIKVYERGNYNTLLETIPHGLTISDEISVRIDKTNNGKCNIILSSISGLFVVDDKNWDGYSNSVTIKSINSSLSDCVLTYGCNDWPKDIWMFGDSYFDLWPPFMYSEKYLNYLIDGYSGRNSADGLASLLINLAHNKPKCIIWALGMNDPDTSTEISSAWKNVVDGIIELCNTYKIELILFTIPNTDSRNNSFKNAYIRNSRYRYVDIAKAVGSDINTDWYSGLKAQDDVHPTTLGRKVIAARVMADVPELRG